MAVWRLITHHESPERQAHAFLDFGWIAIGWTSVGDLRKSRPTGPADISSCIREAHETSDGISHGGASLWRFYQDMNIGDLVILASAKNRFAVVRVSGDYTFVPEKRAEVLGGYTHRRAADFVDFDPDALWQACGARFAAGENSRWTLARCQGDESTTWMRPTKIRSR